MAQLPDPARRLCAGSPEAIRDACVGSVPGLHELVRVAILSLCEDAARSAVSIEFDLACDCRPGPDAARLEAILVGLASDAIRAMPAGGVLRVECRREGETVVFSVGDSGAGIGDVSGDPLPAAARLPAEARSGVAAARAFVAERDGEVEIGEAEGAGSAIQLRLPLLPAG